MSALGSRFEEEGGDSHRGFPADRARRGDVAFTVAGPASAARALLTVRSAASVFGPAGCVVLASDTCADLFEGFEVLRPADVLPDAPLASEFLEEDELVAYAEPFALARLRTSDGVVIRLAAGAFVVERPRELTDLLDDAVVALAVPTLVTPADSLVPHLALREPDGVVSDVVVGLTGGADIFLEQWQAAMADTAFDLQRTAPRDVTGRVFASWVGNPQVAIEGATTLMTWYDFAAVRSGAATADVPAIVDTGDLWDVITPQARTAGGMTAAAYRLIDLRVHDPAPLDPIIAAIRAAESDDVPIPAVTPFEQITHEFRRASDPLGLRWGPDATEDLREWLFSPNERGLTRIADLVWYGSPDLTERFPEARIDPTRYRDETSRSLRVAMGFDPFGNAEQSIGPGSQAPVAEEPVEVPIGRGNRMKNALAWRWNTVLGVVPGIDTVKARRAEREAIAAANVQEGIVISPRRRIERKPALWGDAPRRLSLIGSFRTESGLGQAARASVAAVRHLGIPFTHIDTSDAFASRSRIDVGLERGSHGAVGDVNLVHSNIPEMISTNDDVLRHRLGGRFNAAMWFWEARNLPDRLQGALDRVDELWLASEYLADVFGQYGRVPVHVVGLASSLPEPRRSDRAAFGWGADEFVFLFVFDAFSSKGRKNPDKVMQAFVEAFGPQYDGVRLVVKVSNLNKFPADRDWLMEIASVTPAIEVIDAYYSHDQIYNLMAAADVYVSLHAAEGYGLTLLEAMSLGTPVICTGYSGNLDFTDEENSWLVRYQLVETTEQTGPYPPGSIWAAPDVEDAASIMRHVVESPAEVKEKSVRARRAAEAAASLDRYAEHLGAHLRRVL